MIEAHTYGDSKAAEVLVDLLIKEPLFQAKVGAYWSDYTFTMKEILRADGMAYPVRLHLGDLFFHHMRKIVEDSCLTSEIKTYLMNIIVKHWRQVKAKLK